MPEDPEVNGFLEKVSTGKGVWDELASLDKTTASTTLSKRKGKGKGTISKKSVQPTGECMFTFCCAQAQFEAG